MTNSEFLNIVLKYCIKEYIVIRKFAQDVNMNVSVKTLKICQLS